MIQPDRIYDPDEVARSWVSEAWIQTVVAEAIRQTAERCATIAQGHLDKYKCGKLCVASIDQDCTDSIADEIKQAFQLLKKPAGSIPSWPAVITRQTPSAPPAPVAGPAD
jgi:hypothetical protein